MGSGLEVGRCEKEGMALQICQAIQNCLKRGQIFPSLAKVARYGQQMHCMHTPLSTLNYGQDWQPLISSPLVLNLCEGLAAQKEIEMTLSQLQASSAAPWLARDGALWEVQIFRHPFLPWPSSTDPRMCSRETLASSNWKASSWCWKTRRVNQRRLGVGPWGSGVGRGSVLEVTALKV